WAWGNNERGILGDGSAYDALTPIQIGTDTDWSWVKAGYQFSMAQKTNGTLWSWGWENYLGRSLYNDITTVSCTTLSVDVPTLTDTLRFYPNPTQDDLYVSQPIHGYQVLDLKGQVLLNSKAHTQRIDVRTLTPGLYIVQVNDAQGGQQAFKVIKQ